MYFYSSSSRGGSYVFMPDGLTVDAADNDRKVLYVGEDQPYQSVQDAVYAANKGDTVFVKSGTYTESIQINKDYIIIQGTTS